MSTVEIIDFTRVIDEKDLPRYENGKPKSISKKQLRARARRKQKKGKTPTQELNLLHKPIEEWDMEELARGRPRAVDGSFKGRPPSWLTREVYEQAMDRFRSIMREQVQEGATGAIDVVKKLMHSDEVDDKGKPIVPPSVQLDAAKWLTEHIIGKPTQRIENDISLKMQAVLSQCVWTPGTPAPALQGPVHRIIDTTPETADGTWDAEVDDDDE